jgi:Protein of unknown function (DUF2852)
MAVAAKLDEWGMGAWIALLVLGFIIWWPLGLATLAFLIWSGRMGCWKRSEVGRWQGERMKEASRWWHQPPSSGNRAFDEYRAETLQRLEEEQREFKEFLERLRVAKDKTEFDAFMADRRNRTAPQAPPAQG